ncbi:MAG: beta-propeller fold lactonase family protein [Leptospirales bacterium]|nr:beta-propeller fold lactonase family protein [Leptospirales bacterium]
MRKKRLTVVMCLFLLVQCSASHDCEPTDITCSPLLATLAYSKVQRGRGVYASTNASQIISMFRIDFVNSTMDLAGAGSIATGGTTRGIAVDSAASIVYAAVITFPELKSFRADPETGVLTHLQSFTMPSGNGNTLAMHPSGRFIYAVGSTQIQVYSADGKGGMNSVGGLVGGLSSSRKPIVDPTGRYLYVGDAATTFKRFDIASDGTLSNMISPSCGVQAISLAFAQNGSLVHCFNPTTSDVSHYRLQADGSLLAAGTYTPGVAGYTAGAYAALESILFIVDSTANLIRPHLVDASSANVVLSPIGTPISVPATATDILIDPTGRYIALLSNASVSLLSIGADGYSLRLIGTQNVPTASDFVLYRPFLF